MVATRAKKLFGQDKDPDMGKEIGCVGDFAVGINKSLAHDFNGIDFAEFIKIFNREKA